MIRNKDDFKTEYKRISNQMFRRDPEHLDDKDKFADGRLELYKKYHYIPLTDMIPLFIQIPLSLLQH